MNCDACNYISEVEARILSAEDEPADLSDQFRKSVKVNKVYLNPPKLLINEVKKVNNNKCTSAIVIKQYANPNEYRQLHGNTLLESHKLPEIANNLIPIEQRKNLAANNTNKKYYQQLEGDIHALKLLGDLDALGLGEYKHYIYNN